MNLIDELEAEMFAWKNSNIERENDVRPKMIAIKFVEEIERRLLEEKQTVHLNKVFIEDAVIEDDIKDIFKKIKGDV